MLTQDAFRQLALSFTGSEESPHFDKASFRYKKKIFATLWEKDNKAMIKLPLNEQSVFCSYDPMIFSPVPGTWGKQGATFVDLAKANKRIVKEALAISFQLLQSK